jgi:uncharacterized membrane protein
MWAKLSKKRHMKHLRPYEDLLLILFVALAALLVATIPALSVSVARSVTGIVVVLFVPGYAFIAALFPRKTTLNSGIRLGLSIGLSIAIVPLLEMALNNSRWGVREGPTLVIIALFVLVCIAAAALRRHRLAAAERFAVNWRVWKTQQGRQASRLEGRFDRALSIALVVAIGVSLATVGCAVFVPKADERFTEFYVLGANDTLGNYTTRYTVGVPSPVTAVIINHEGRNVTYNLIISENSGTQRGVVYSEEVIVPAGQQWQKQIDLILNQQGNEVQLDFALYADHSTPQPYRDAHLWVNVSAERLFDSGAKRPVESLAASR